MTIRRTVADNDARFRRWAMQAPRSWRSSCSLLRIVAAMIFGRSPVAGRGLA